MPLQLSCTSTYVILCNTTQYIVVINPVHTIIRTLLHSHTHLFFKVCLVAYQRGYIIYYIFEDSINVNKN
jgi:hypothetical protein